MMHVPTCDKLKQEFLAKYSQDFDITGGVSWRHFGVCRLSNQRTRFVYLDNYIRETLDEYKVQVTKSLRPKCTPIQPTT
jgi:hypothetical protein